MRKIVYITTLLLILLAISEASFAAIKTGNAGKNVKYEFNDVTGELHIYGTGSMYDRKGNRDYKYTGDSPIKTYRDQIKSVVIDEGVTSIGAAFFYQCTKLTSVSIPNSVTLINYEAFRGCSSLERITIPASVSDIRERSFTDCTKLSYIDVDKDSPYYTSVGGVVYTKDLKTIVRFPEALNVNNYVIPEGVTKAETDALYKLSYVKAITIPTTMTYIDYGSFDNSPNLKTMVFKSMTPPGFGKSETSGITITTIYVPCGAEEDYKKSNWGGFKVNGALKQSVVVDFNVYTNDPTLGDVTEDRSLATCDQDVAKIKITAVPTTVGQFGHWQDGVTTNPRTIEVPATGAGKIEYTAIFEPREYTVKLTKDLKADDGTRKGKDINSDIFQLSMEFEGVQIKTKNTDNSVSGKYHYGDVITLYCGEVANGYKFKEWSDGNKDNPRTYKVTGDVELKAKLAVGQVTIKTVASGGSTYGTTTPSSETVNFGESVTIRATPTSNYVFARWDDGDTHAERTVTATVDKTYTAYFNVKTFKVNVTVAEDESWGSVSGYGTFNASTDVSLVATANEGYEFKEWSGDKTGTAKTLGISNLDKDYNITATFKPKEYTIIFLGADGTQLSSRKEKYNTMPTLPANPTKASTAEYEYIFAGWSPTVEKVTGDQTYAPLFNSTKRSYTIKFVDGDGKVVQEGLVEYGKTPVYSGATPTKTATAQYSYKYRGSWDKELAPVTGNVTYTAQFNQIVNEYDITFVDEDGSTILKATEKVEYGNTPTPPANPTKTQDVQYTYSFTGWSPAVGSVTKSQVYKATYGSTLRKYDITFKDGDDNTIQTVKVDYGTVPSYTGSIPTKSSSDEFDYTFNGNWSPELSAVTGAQTYTAQFGSTTRKYTVTFKNYDGEILQSGAVEYRSIPVYSRPEPTKPADAKTKWKFSGWNPAIKAVYGEQVYTAQFVESEAILYTITFTNPGGDIISQKKYRYGEIPSFEGDPVLEPSVDKEFSFFRWNPQFAEVDGDATYEAEYKSTPRKYQILFVDENGTTVLQKSEIAYGTKPSYTGATPTKAATAEYTYTHNGWTPEVKEVDGAATYTAVYQATKNEYEVSFIDYDGRVLKKEKVVYGNDATAPSDPTREGYTFISWSGNYHNITKAVTITATYNINKYTIIFNNEDGTQLDKQECEYGVTPTYIGKPIKAATAEYTYTFKSWDKTPVAATEDATYTATYSSEKNKYKIDFCSEDGKSVLQTLSVEYGVKPEYTKDNPVKAKTAQYTYTFAGWTPEVVSVTGDAKYCAKFSEKVNEYEITFVNWDGSELEYGIDKYEYGMTPIYPGTPVKASDVEFSYIFDGWTPIVQSVTKDETYTAHYTPVKNSYKIYFKNYDNTILQEEQFEYGILPKYNGQDPEKVSDGMVNYTFTGWSPTLKTVTGEATYIAQYSSAAVVYTVDLVDYDETLIQTLKFDAGSKLVVDIKPSRPTTDSHTYEFTGWYPAITASTTVSENMTLKATYKETLREYDITFVVDGVSTTSKVKYGEMPTAPANPQKKQDVQYSYSFDKWDREVVAVAGDATYTAVFNSTVRKYLVKFLNYDNEELQSSEWEYGTIPSCAEPTRPGDAQYTYTFSGWDKTPAPVTGEATYKAQYDDEVNTYTVTFKNYDGLVISSGTYKYGETPSCDVTPAKDATDQYTFIFDKWSPAITSVTGPAEYVAHYSESLNSYNITFANEDGTTIKTISVPYGEEPEYEGQVPVKTATAQYTYTFAGWTPEVVAVTKPATYKASFNALTNKYTIIFKNGDTVLQSSEIEYGAEPSYDGALPLKEGTAQYSYSFDGWDKTIVSVIGDAVYSAKFAETVNSYKIQFLNYNDDVLQETLFEYGTIPSYSGSTPTKPSDEKDNYTFKDWTPSIAPVTGEATYKASFTNAANVYSVTFVDYNGKELLKKGVASDEIITCDLVPSRTPDEGKTYTFIGWDPVLSDNMKPTKDIMFTAQYKEDVRKYTIRFLMDDGTTEIQSAEVAYGTMPTAPTEVKKESSAQYSYEFESWDKTLVEVDGNADYIARFSAETRSYTISFLDYDRNVIKSIDMLYGEMPSCEEPSREGDKQHTYTFSGWEPIIVSVNTDAEYIATYKESTNEYLVTFKNEDGTVLKSEKYEYGIKPNYDGTPVKSADAQYTYTFSGWDKEIVEVDADAVYTATYSNTLNTYNITFTDEDGTMLYTAVGVKYGDMPNYEGQTPVKSSTAQYVYTFDDWSPKVDIVKGAATYTATYKSELRKYEVVFKNGDTELQHSEVEYGVTPTYSGATPVKASDTENVYTFSGWSPVISAVDGDVTYDAQFASAPRKYTITFVNYDEAILQQSEFEYGVMPKYNGDVPKQPSDGVNNYTFMFWSPELTYVTRDATYYAIYSSADILYTVTFRDYDGTILLEKNFEPGQLLVGILTPKRPSEDKLTYEFAGWDPEITAGMTVDSDMTFTATYTETLRKYTIRFVSDDGREISSSEVEYGKMPEAPENVEKESSAEFSYTFKSWDKEIVAVSGDATYTAQFDAMKRKYMIKFLDYDGREIQVQEVEYGEKPTCSDPVRDADAQFTYTFIGWDKQVVAVAGEETYTAVYEEVTNMYLVTFKNEDGTVLKSDMYKYGAMPVYDGTPVKSADVQYTYAFSGWDKEIVEVVGEAIYTATYSKTLNRYNITFVDEDGTTLYTAVGVEYGDMPEYQGQVPVKSSTAQYNYIFDDWSPNIEAVKGDATYTATYKTEVRKYSIVFKNGDAELQRSDVEYGAMPKYEGETPTKASDEKENYTFSGWSPEVRIVEGDAIYVAQFTQELRKYTITFVNYDGTVLQQSQSDYGEMPVYNGGVPTRPSDGVNDYTFMFWSPELTYVTEDATYAATYSTASILYNVVFRDYDGTILLEKKYEAGQSLEVNLTPQRTSTAEYTYEFAGWNPEFTVGTTVDSDMTFTATYTETLRKYTIRFVSDDGREISSSEIEYGKMPEAPENVEKESSAEFSYTFKSWDKEIVAVSGDATYTAQFDAMKRKYMIKFLDYDGAEIQSHEVEYGEKPTCADPVRDADAQYTYTFIGWDKQVVAVIGDAIYTAQYSSEIRSYNITFVNYDDVVLQKIIAEYGTLPTYTGATLERESEGATNYTFKGWYPEIVYVNGDATYKAVYSSADVIHTVTFVDYDGTVLLVKKFEDGEKLTVDLVPLRNGDEHSSYTFVGWNPEITSGMVVKSDLTFTAVYSETMNSYRIDVLSNNDSYGTATGSGEYEYGQVVTLEAIANQGYVFVKWDDNQTVSKRQITVTENKTFTAIFNVIQEDKPQRPEPVDPDSPCYYSVPAVALYDWLLMIDVNWLKEGGYKVEPNNVTWYRVVDAQDDDCNESIVKNDEVVGFGFYYTMDNNLIGTGDYYAVVNMGSKKFRTKVFTYSANNKVMLLPTRATRGQVLHIKGLVGEAVISVYDINGKLISREKTDGSLTYDITAAETAGVYVVHIYDGRETVVKYLVK